MVAIKEVKAKEVKVKEVKLEFIIDPAQVIRAMGYSEAAPPNLEERIAQAVNDAMPLIQPSGTYTTLKIKSVADSVTTKEITIQSRDVAALLKPCSRLSLLLVTIGPLIEQRAQESDALDSLILDTLGSIAVEEAANKVNQIISDEAEAKGFKTTRRYSVGYGDWNISQQKELLVLLEGKKIGVTLTESSIMLPQKSITAVLGWHEGTRA